jgi:hypothetical protein
VSTHPGPIPFSPDDPGVAPLEPEPSGRVLTADELELVKERSRQVPPIPHPNPTRTRAGEVPQAAEPQPLPTTGREATRARIRAELATNPTRSNREIGRVVGCSDKTVGVVRAEGA